MIRTALYTGSFDPLTNGHIDVIRQAAASFDRLVIAIGVHPGKTPALTFEERAQILREACAELAPATPCLFEVASFSGLSVDAARTHGACVLLRGLRDGTDFDYEMQMAGTNAAIAPGLGTVFIPSSPGVRHISATLVRQIALLGGDISALAPAASASALRRANARGV
jgi:pantetheine-phosphate adenylyltransferase